MSGGRTQTRTYLAEGGCLCGSVRYAVTSEPEYLIQCACNFCQRATGSHYLVETLFPLEDLDVTSGTPRTFDVTSSGSGKVIHIHFCEGCGTKLFMTFERYDDIYGVFTGTFDDTNWFSRRPETPQYFYVGKMPDGMVIPAGYEAFYGHGLKLDGSSNTPQVFDSPILVTSKVRKAALEFAKLHGEA